MNDDDNLTPFEALKNTFNRHFDPMAGVIGTGAATVGRLVFYPVEATSFSMQTGAANTVKDAIKLNFNSKNIKESFRGGTSLVKQAILSSGSYYGLGFAVMKAHKDDPILVQGAWAMTTVIPEQLSVIEAVKTVRDHSKLSSKNISRKGWWRINAAYFGRHMYGNPATLVTGDICERELEKVVPQQYHPVSSFFAGPMGVWLTHRTGYSFMVATSVQLMVNPDQSFKQAWKNAASGNFIKAGDVRALGRMGTIGVAFLVRKLYGMYFSQDTSVSSTPTAPAQHSTLFARSAVKNAADTEQNHAPSARRT